MAIRIFITGGTFDKEYNELNGQLYFKDTHMQDLLEMGRSKAAYGDKDTDDDRQPGNDR